MTFHYPSPPPYTTPYGTTYGRWRVVGAVWLIGRWWDLVRPCS